MRSLELHAPVQQIQRSKGRSSVEAAAYRSASRLTDERTGLMHDFSKKGGVEHSQIYLPDNAPTWASNREQLWNAAEKKENRGNSCTAMEWEFSFPAEFSSEQRREAGGILAREIVRRYSCAADISYHRPSRDGDQRNYHAHLLFTSRGFDASTKDGWAKNKFRDLSQDTKDKNKKPYLDAQGQKTTRGKLEVLCLREFVSSEINKIAERDHVPVRVDHLSFKKRGIEKMPQIHIGHTASANQKKYEQGLVSEPNERYQRNAQIISFNNSRAVRLKQAREYLQVKKQLADIAAKRAEILRQIEEAKREQKQLQEAANRKGLRGLIDAVTGKKRETKKRLADTSAEIAKAKQEKTRQEKQAAQIRAEQQRQIAEKKRQAKVQARIESVQKQAANDAHKPPERGKPRPPLTKPPTAQPPPQSPRVEFTAQGKPRPSATKPRPSAEKPRPDQSRRKRRDLDM